jgi:mannose-6-phosphate isomerase-like protein (cupin superfamily)
MKGFITDIEQITLQNDYFRKVLYTAKHSQLVVMSLKPTEDIGEETHQLDQFFRCEAGVGIITLDGIHHPLAAGTAILVPAGNKHNITNTSSEDSMKLYTIYAPPNHKDGVIHKTKAEAEADTEVYTGHSLPQS